MIVKTPKIDDCIEYIESCGWRLVLRKRGTYLFHLKKRCEVIDYVEFTLKEIREAYLKGW